MISLNSFCLNFKTYLMNINIIIIPEIEPFDVRINESGKKIIIKIFYCFQNSHQYLKLSMEEMKKQ